MNHYTDAMTRSLVAQMAGCQTVDLKVLSLKPGYFECLLVVYFLLNNVLGLHNYNMHVQFDQLYP